MSYREIHELFVVCDECHTSLSVDDATYEDADNEAVDHGWQCDEFQGRHYCPLHWHVECHDCDITDSGAEIIHATASVRTTVISHAANAASGMSDRCIGSNTMDGRSTQTISRRASARNA